MNVTRWIWYTNVLFDKLMGLCYETLIPMYDVVACILLAIYKFSCVHVESGLPC